MFDICSSQPSLPAAPRKRKAAQREYNFAQVRRRLFGDTSLPPAASFEPLTILTKWDYLAIQRETSRIARTGWVREKFLRFTPLEVAEESGEEFLEWLWGRYFPVS